MDEIQELRLEFGDLDKDIPILTDEDYEILIKKANGRKRALSKSVAMSILAVLSQEVRERSGQEERYGSEAFANFMKFVKMKLKNPMFSGIRPVVYFGGVFRDDVSANALDTEVVQSQFYKGRANGYADWQTNRSYRSDGNIEPEVNAEREDL